MMWKNPKTSNYQTYPHPLPSSQTVGRWHIVVWQPIQWEWHGNRCLIPITVPHNNSPGGSILQYGTWLRDHDIYPSALRQLFVHRLLHAVPMPAHYHVCCPQPVTSGLCGLEHEAEAWLDADCGCGMWRSLAWLGCFHHLCWDIGSIITQQNGLSRLSALSDSQTDHRLTVWHAANMAAIMRSSRWLSVLVYILLPHSFY